MKETLIIGSTVLDIIIDVPKLPTTSEDVHIQEQTLAIGGCAFNVAHIIRLFQLPHTFCSPVGTGMYGNFVAEKLSQMGIIPFVRLENQDNGCCYCLVEPHGERTFLSSHGAEYTFDESWLSHLDMHLFDTVYICGLEIEEATGDKIISFLKKTNTYKSFLLRVHVFLV
jgi:sugar/nucleoside kinase (ribokinase family)